MIARRIVVAGATVYGATMIAVPTGWRTELFRPAFHLAGPRWWGVGFAVCGIAALVTGRPVAIGALGAVLSAWTVCLIWGVISGLADTGHPPTSLAGWVWPAVAVLVLVVAPRPER